MSRFRREPLVILAAAAVVMTGCVAPHKPGVSIDTLDADIVFGLSPAAPPPSPPGVPQLGAPPADAPQTTAKLPELPDIPELPVLAPLATKGAPPPICPTARQGAFPQLPASTVVAAPPQAGSYRWKPTPPQQFEGDAFPVQPAQLITRTIYDVSPVSTSTGPDLTQAGAVPGTTTISTFTYKMLTRRPEGTSAVDTFKVTEHAVRTTAGANAGPTLHAGDPARGVALLSHVEYNAKGQAVSSFTPPEASPLLLLPLDVVAAEQFQSVASDPTTGATYTLTGVVNKRSMVDACGDEVDGWEVDARTSFTYAVPGPGGTPGGGVTQTATYTYYIATQLGGILTYEHVVPLDAIPTPPTGTALDGVLPSQTNVPANPLPASPYEISLASAAPVKG